MAKLDRERAVKEKRVRKQEKKDARAAAREAGIVDPTESAEQQDEDQEPVAD
jgi:hypothetical protein